MPKIIICNDECNFVEGAKVVPVTSTEQLIHWINDDPVHSSLTNECCPDFSCCGGKISSMAFRKAFLRAHISGDRKTVEMMLMGCLGGMTSELDTKTYISGSTPTEPSN